MASPHPYGSIQQLIDDGYGVSEHHAQLRPPCTHNADLDLIELRRQFGAGYNLIANREAFLARLRCSSCGRKGSMSLMLRPRR